MTAIHSVGAAPTLPEWDSCADKTLYWTLSLHIDRSRLPESFHAVFHPQNKLKVQNSYQASATLRDAMEPLFNDIADRERLSEVNDYLLDVPGPRQGEWINVHIPNVIEWTTEGTRFSADLGQPQTRLVRCRRFWYVHIDGSLSYHVSFSLKYEHTPADFYFISMLQKVLAPKEFIPASTGDKDTAAISVATPATGIFPIDQVLIHAISATTDGSNPPLPFWQYIRQCFDAHATDLFEAFGLKIKDGHGRVTKDLFGTLVATDPFIEVPNLHMPRARFLFLFDDRQFFRDLLPKPDEGRNRRSRRDFVDDARFDCFKEWIQAELKKSKGDRPQAVQLTSSYLDAVQSEVPERLRYLFLSGFIQNIIDFMNQDASEILDSTDPVYPATQEQEEESFFIRYTNQRSITQFVPGSRSLETGNDFIGTCPYVFLVHLLAMHNEYLARNYERQTEDLTKAIKTLSEQSRFSEVARRFHDFRIGPFSDYQRYKYTSVFRYDSERDLFEAVEKFRGTHRKDAYLSNIVNNLEAQTRDLEGRQRAKVDRQFSLLLAAVGLFSVLQVLYQVLDISTDTSGRAAGLTKPVDMIDFEAPGLANKLAEILFVSTSVSLLLTFLLTLWVLRNWFSQR
jgi:hypothetical protein